MPCIGTRGKPKGKMIIFRFQGSVKIELNPIQRNQIDPILLMLIDEIDCIDFIGLNEFGGYIGIKEVGCPPVPRGLADPMIVDHDLPIMIGRLR